MSQGPLATTVAIKNGAQTSLRAAGPGNALVTASGGMLGLYVDSNIDTVLYTGAATVSRAIVGTAGVDSTLTIHDGINVIAEIDTAVLGTYELGVLTTTSLRVVTTGGTPAKVTVVWGV